MQIRLLGDTLILAERTDKQQNTWQSHFRRREIIFGDLTSPGTAKLSWS